MATISTQDVQDHLLGITDLLPDNPGLEERLVADAIAAAEAEFERTTRVLLTPRLIRMNPGSDDCDLEEDPLTLRHMNTARSPRFQLRHRPVIELLSFRFEFSTTNRVQSFPLSNVRANKRLGIVTLIPFTNLTAGLAGASAYWALMGVGSWPGDHIPQFVCIDYRAGYTDADTNSDLADVRHALADRAAAQVLDQVRRLVPGSANLDGFSQQFDTMAQMIADKTTSWKAFLQSFMARERPLVVGVL